MKLGSICKKLSVLLGVFIVVTSNAQQSYRFEKITVENGLSQSSITSIVQDQYGYLWISTLDGLNKYDGKQFKVYKHDATKPGSICPDEIQSLHLDRQKQLWVVFKGVISRYIPEYDSFENIEITNREENLSGVFAAHSLSNLTDSSLLISTNNGFLGYSLLKKKFYRISAFKQFKELNLRNYLNSPELGEWVFSLNEIFVRFNKNEAWLTILKDSLAIANYYDPNSKEIYLQTKTTLFKFETKSRKLKVVDTYKSNDFEANNFGMIKRKNGSLWVFRREIHVYDGNLKKEAVLKHLKQDPYSLSGKYLSCIYESQDGVVWVGTNGLGLNKYNPNTAVFHFTGAFYGAPISLSESYVKAIYTADDNELYVANNTNVDHIDLKNSKSQAIDVKTSNGSFTRVNRFLAGDGDVVWLCTDNGLKYLKNNITYPSNIPLFDNPSLWITDYAKIDNNHYIMSTSSGLFLWDTQKRSARKLSSRVGLAICLFNNKIWIDSEESIFLIDLYSGSLDKEYRKTSKEEDAFPLAFIRCFYPDKEGNLWIGSWGGGLTLFNSATEKFISFKEKQGLPDLVIYSILEDDKNHLWLSTNNGLSVFDKTNKRVIRNYTKEDGLQGNEFNTRASFKSSSGVLYFGGVNGLTYFKPDEVLNIKQVAPQAILKAFYVKHERVDTISGGFAISAQGNQTIDLSWDENNFEVELSSLNYTLAGQTRYKYLLENFDSNWNDIADREFISFSNLPAGNYKLRIKAYTIQGAMQHDDLIIMVNIHQPLWRNKDFYFYLILSLLIIIVVSYRLRANFFRKKSETLNRLVLERTKELQIKNEEILTQNEEIVAQNEEITLQNETLSEIKKSLEQMVEKRTISLTELNTKLAAQNSQLEQFAFITAHNIRGPVARIKGLVNLLPIKSIELDYLIISVKDLDDLIIDLNDILDVQFNTDKTKFELVNLREVVLKVISMFKEQIQDNEATLDISEFQDPMVRGIKSYFNSIFYNLLSNGFKYSDLSRKPKIIFSSFIKDSQLHITVSDNGIGIDKSYTKGKIFNMYQRFHPEIVGKGFGLFLVRSQVEAMDGRISFESEVGKGTTFIIIFDGLT